MSEIPTKHLNDVFRLREKHVMRACRISGVVCIIITFVSAVTAVYGTAAAFLNEKAAFDLPLVSDFLSIGFKRIFFPFEILMENSETYDEAARDTAFNGILSAFLIFIGVISFLFFTVLKRIIEGGSPFSEKNVKTMKLMMILMFCCGIFQPLMLFAALVLMAVAYIFQYGGMLQDKAKDTIKIQENIIFSFAEITESKSGQTGQHIRRVSEYSKTIALKMGLGEEKAEEIRVASVLHDVGKLMIDSKILDKPDRLTNEEYSEIKKHVSYGDALLANVQGDILQTARIIARDHHERFDGKGYSSGASGEEISLEGRIVAVADVFDALTSKRSYKEAWSIDDAFNEIIKNSGTQFDPNVVETFKANRKEICDIYNKFGGAK